MYKKMILSLIVIIFIVGLSNAGFASATNDRYEIIKPEKLSFSSSEKILLINGRAPSGTEISISVYGTTDLTRRSFNLDKLPTEQEYILIATEKVTSGNLGLFQKQMDLVRGINKIIIDFGVSGVPSREYIIFTYDPLRTEINIPLSVDSRFGDLINLVK